MSGAKICGNVDTMDKAPIPPSTDLADAWITAVSAPCTSWDNIILLSRDAGMEKKVIWECVRPRVANGTREERMRRRSHFRVEQVLFFPSFFAIHTDYHSRVASTVTSTIGTILAATAWKA